MDIGFRPAMKEDAAALLKIYSEYVLNTAVSFEYEVPTLEEFEKRITTTLKNYPYLVLDCAGEIGGYAYAGRAAVRAAFDWSVETSIYIAKDLQGEGFGRSLYEYLEMFLKSQHVTNEYARIAATTRANDEYLTDGSLRFHEALGFKTVGRLNNCGYKFGKWYDLVYMEKIISEHKAEQEPFIPFSKLKSEDLVR